ncbi:MAG TPA: PP0621 family protein [Pseudoduganella sp.]|jgi:uncharacterized protein
MTRILFWLALVFLVIAAIRAKLRSARHVPPPSTPQRPAARPADTPEAMLCCTHCGVHYPASENVPVNGRDYCSTAHAQLAAK